MHALTILVMMAAVIAAMGGSSPIPAPWHQVSPVSDSCTFRFAGKMNGSEILECTTGLYRWDGANTPVKISSKLFQCVNAIVSKWGRLYCAPQYYYPSNIIFWTEDLIQWHNDTLALTNSGERQILMLKSAGDVLFVYGTSPTWTFTLLATRDGKWSTVDGNFTSNWPFVANGSFYKFGQSGDEVLYRFSEKKWGFVPDTTKRLPAQAFVYNSFVAVAQCGLECWFATIFSNESQAFISRNFWTWSVYTPPPNTALFFSLTCNVTTGDCFPGGGSNDPNSCPSISTNVNRGTWESTLPFGKPAFSVKGLILDGGLMKASFGGGVVGVAPQSNPSKSWRLSSNGAGSPSQRAIGLGDGFAIISMEGYASLYDGSNFTAMPLPAMQLYRGTIRQIPYRHLRPAPPNPRNYEFCPAFTGESEPLYYITCDLTSYTIFNATIGEFYSPGDIVATKNGNTVVLTRPSRRIGWYWYPSDTAVFQFAGSKSTLCIPAVQSVDMSLLQVGELTYTFVVGNNNVTIYNSNDGCTFSQLFLIDCPEGRAENIQASQESFMFTTNGKLRAFTAQGQPLRTPQIDRYGPFNSVVYSPSLGVYLFMAAKSLVVSSPQFEVMGNFSSPSNTGYQPSTLAGAVLKDGRRLILSVDWSVMQMELP